MKFILAGIFAVFAINAKAEILVVAAPFTEFPALAAQMLDGAKAAAAGNWVIRSVDAGCTSERSAIIANLIIAEKPDAAIGFPCIESLTPALNALGPLGVPIITIASRAGEPSKVAQKNQWRLYRIGPREKEESGEIAKLIVGAWRGFKTAILDDGTIFARDTAEAIRNEFENAGLKPVLVEGFQPQLENQRKLIDRLTSVGASHVFIAGDRANIAQIAIEAAGLNLTIAGPETLRATDVDHALPAGVYMAARNSEVAQAATLKINAMRQTPFALAEGYSADAFIATEIAMALTSDVSLRVFDTAAGQMDAIEDGFIHPVRFELFRFDGASFVKTSP